MPSTNGSLLVRSSRLASLMVNRPGVWIANEHIAISSGLLSGSTPAVTR